MKKISIILLLLCLVGCSVSRLRYVGDDNIKIQDFKKSEVDAIYVKKVGICNVGIGILNERHNDILGVLIKIENLDKKRRLIVNPRDFVAETQNRYFLKKLPSVSYTRSELNRINLQLEKNKNAQLSQKSHNTIKCQNDLYGNMNCNEDHSIATGLMNLSDNLLVAQKERELLEKMQRVNDYTEEISIHALNHVRYIEPQSWDYYYIFFESPYRVSESYPINIYYKNAKFIFDFIEDNASVSEILF